MTQMTSIKSANLSHKLTFFIVILSSILFMTLTSFGPAKFADNKTKPDFLNVKGSWADSVFNSLTPDERIAQLFMVAAYSNKGPEHIRKIDELVTKYKIGGLIFFKGGPLREAKLTNHYQSKAKTPLYIAIDGEWGVSMRLDSTTVYPRQMMLGAIQDDALIYEMGKQIAKQCQLLGIHINFAPVIDINNNPKNPVINNRSFGELKKQVTKLSSEVDDLRDNIFYFIKNLDESSVGASNFYINILGYLQDMTQSLEYISKVSHKHINNNHKKLKFNQIKELKPEYLVISPGPCDPEHAGISLAVVESFAGKIPLLGVCLGHQCIAQQFGANVIKAKKLMHGKTSTISHTGTGLFQGIKPLLQVTRYHSLIVEPKSLSNKFTVTAWSIDELGNQEEMMALQHNDLPVCSVQFHPESILTEHGQSLLKNFLTMYASH